MKIIIIPFLLLWSNVFAVPSVGDYVTYQAEVKRYWAAPYYCKLHVKIINANSNVGLGRTQYTVQRKETCDNGFSEESTFEVYDNEFRFTETYSKHILKHCGDPLIVYGGGEKGRFTLRDHIFDTCVFYKSSNGYYYVDIPPFFQYRINVDEKSYLVVDFKTSP